MAMFGAIAIGLFFSFKIYPDLEYTGYGNGVHSCTGECYAEYVRVNGTAVEIEQRKNELASQDEFSSIRGLWARLCGMSWSEWRRHGSTCRSIIRLHHRQIDYI